MANNIWTVMMKLSMLYGFYLHSYTSIVICCFGVVTNIINVMVFSHKNMVSPINIILAGVAIADLLQSLEYIPAVYYIYIRLERTVLDLNMSYPERSIGLLHTLFSWVNHGTSTSLTVILFWWRHNALINPLCVSNRRSKHSAVIAVVVCYLIFTLGIIPLAYCILQTTSEDSDYNFNEQVGSATALFFQLCLPWTSFAILMVICIRIVKVMQARNENANTELRVNYHQTSTVMKRRNRSKRLFWLILIMFLVTELPGSFLTAIIIVAYQDMMSVGIFWELNDVLMLVTASTNFFMYYLMSCEFRETFHLICGDSPSQASKVRHQSQSSYYTLLKTGSSAVNESSEADISMSSLQLSRQSTRLQCLQNYRDSRHMDVESTVESSVY